MMRLLRRMSFDARPLALALLLLPAVPAAAEAPSPALEDTVGAVDGAVVVVRTFEHMTIFQDGVRLVPMSDLGSGVLISAEGDVLTAAHLVQVADTVGVEFVDGTIVAAKVVASDWAADLALLRLESVPEGAVVAKLGDSDRIRVGERVFVIGAPYGLSHSLTVGHVSARHPPGRPGRPLHFAELFQADVPIQRGNSGGPMFNMAGEVIGIVSHMMTRSGSFEGVGFAVTSNSVRELLLTRRMPWSGVSVFGLDGQLSRIFNLPQESGLLVQRVAAGSPGARLGLIPSYLPLKIGEYEFNVGGDIILEVEGIRVGTYEGLVALRERFSRMEKGRSVTVKVLRRGEVVELSTVLGE